MEPSEPKSATGSGSEPRSVSTTSAVWHPTHIAEQRQKLVLNAFAGFLANDRWLAEQARSLRWVSYAGRTLSISAWMTVADGWGLAGRAKTYLLGGHALSI